MAKPVSIAVVGGGLAGLTAAIKIAEAGQHVQLFSIVPVKRSHSVCAQGGINAAVNTKGEGDSPWEHFDDSIYGGDFLADQPPVLRMCEAAPGYIYMFDRMGVPFTRTREGLIDFRRFGGTKHHRTAYAGATTGQQLLYALDEQVRRFEDDGKVTKQEGWELLSLVIDQNRICRGLTAIDLWSMEVDAFPADAVILATGGIGAIFGKSTNSIICTGSAQAAAYQQGAVYANGEFIQVHPTAIPGEDKHRLMSESVRGEGGRVWTYKNGKPWYFLEEKYPAYGNLVPRDIATREIFQVCLEGHGVDGKMMVYLDITHMDPQVLTRKLGGVLEIYEKFVGPDPRKVPMIVFPAVHYTMGGLWVGFDQMTNLPGLFAAGECDYSIHGANRLGANSLLSCLYGGETAAAHAVPFAQGHQKRAPEKSHPLFTAEALRQREINATIMRKRGPENLRALHEEMGQWMTEHVTVIRHNDKLRRTDEKLRELQERWDRIDLNDEGAFANQSLLYARQLDGMLKLARVITLGAIRRDESRGAHYKPEFASRDDAHWLRTTMATWTPEGPELSYEPVDTSLIPPRPRKYDVEKQTAFLL
ncbi:MAG: succinate dehydrogenase flavoprotein subunit [Acidobacteria bacterium]|nr:succinate dehydrogenase flavoprotein subunit [Acidobacteriota bacterium]